MGIVLSIASAITWFIADLQTGHIYIHPIIPYWNTLMRFGFFLITTFLISNFKKAFDLEKKYSRIDNLTGIPNSRSFYEVVLKEIDISRRYKTYLSILYIDLDNFKLINDTQGHLEGDRLLRSVANHIKNNIRNMDSAARLGGDEFAVLLPHTEFGQAKTVAEKLRSALMDLMQQNDWSVTFSIGLASFIDPPLTVNEIIKKADDLMYSVKRNGKNNIKYEFYN
ncbi:MAG: GGDEF domain-containing protein [Spirochaetota bacterium]|nr:GGDEF domain-containing protein [Spirochaetota bacterium]